MHYLVTITATINHTSGSHRTITMVIAAAARGTLTEPLELSMKVVVS